MHAFPDFKYATNHISTKLLGVQLITTRPRTHSTRIVDAGVVDLSHQHHERSRVFAPDIVKPLHWFHLRPLRICVGDDASEFGNIFQWMGVPGVLQRHISRAFPMYYLLSLRSSRYHTLFGCLRRLASSALAADAEKSGPASICVDAASWNPYTYARVFVRQG